MTERRSRRRKREEEESDEEENEANDEQTEVAKYLRFNCETKSSNYQGQKVEYFKGSKAIDCLLDTKWASGKGGTEILFTDRESVQEYLQGLLELGMFKRVTRVRKKKKGADKDEAKKDSKGAKDSPKPGKSKKDLSEGKSGESEGKKTKVKVKLELHDFQEFFDGDEVYMWIFDPLHPRTIIYGVLVVIGAILVCLFPLWPEQMREYVWYLSVLAAILLGSLLVVALFRYVLFGVVWLLTAGKHHFWLLPNLTEDCGFFESFVPLYTHAYKGTKEDDNVSEEQKDKDDNTGVEKDRDELMDTAENTEGNIDDTENKRELSDVCDDRDVGDREDTEKDDEDLMETRHVEDVPHVPQTGKANIESESWINVTDEDVAQAKQATGNESRSQTMTSPDEC